MSEPTGLDVSVFDALIESGSVEARCQLARELAQLTCKADTPDAERDCVVPPILKLAVDPVADVRRTLASGLAGSDRVHADIVFSIIADDDEIALPFLAATPSLDSWMMIAIIRVGDVSRQVVIARRTDIAPDVIEAIIAQGEINACLTLLDNTSFMPTADHYRTLYQRFSRENDLVARLMRCDDLPHDIRILQTKRASNRAHQLMAERGWFAANDAAELVADAEEGAIIDILTSTSPKELPSVMRFLTSKGMLTPSIVMRAACTGEMEIVEHAIAHLADSSLARVQAVLYGRHGLAFSSLYKNSGLPQSCQGVIAAAADVQREVLESGRAVAVEEFGRRLVEQIMTDYETMPSQERARHLDCIGRFAGDRVRIIASRLRDGLVRAA
ncbi:MAG: DUF2336 domain-containing protein [Parvibaculaceae bacterium]